MSRSTRPTSLFVWFFAVSVTLSACSSGNNPAADARTDTANDTASDAFDVPGDSAMPLDGADDAQGDGAPGDAPPVGLGRRCDMAHACPSGLRCLEGTCHLDCTSNVACGTPERCCAGGEVCVGDTCVAPGAPCATAPGCGGAPATCPRGFYCDATVMRCLPAAGAATCTVPVASEFRPVPAWTWMGSRAHPEYRGVLVTPVVADVNHDGASDVLVVAYRDPPASYGGTIPGHGILCALSGPGDCMGGARELWCSDTGTELNSWANIAVADLDQTDGVNRLTILASLRRGALGGNGIVAFDETGRQLWVGRSGAGVTSDVEVYLGAISVADLDGDGRAEILANTTVFNTDGTVRWDAGVACGGGASIPFAVDLDDPPDGRLEVVCGNAAFQANGMRRWVSTVIATGFAGVADFDADGAPEIVVVSNGSIAVLDRNGGAVVPATTFASLGFAGRGGPPTISDANADGTPDIGVAGSTHYGLFRVTGPRGMRRLERIWSQPADDTSSQITGSAMFDFDGDGIAEVIYQDTCRARVFNGSDGAMRMDIPNISGTATNYPTVADLNGDGRAEFILVTDSYYARSSLIPCPASTPRTDGVRVFRDANDNWQPTRALWNQHAYSVTNVCDGIDSACGAAENSHAAIPRRPTPHWLAGLNSFRANARFGATGRPASDLVPLSLNADVSGCPGNVALRADIGNRGALAAAADTPVSFYETDASGTTSTLLGTVTLGRTLAPGGVVRVELRVMRPASAARSFRVIVVPNDNGMGMGRYRECNRDNNRSAPVDVACDVIG